MLHTRLAVRPFSIALRRRHGFSGLRLSTPLIGRALVGSRFLSSVLSLFRIPTTRQAATTGTSTTRSTAPVGVRTTHRRSPRRYSFAACVVPFTMEVTNMHFGIFIWVHQPGVYRRKGHTEFNFLCLPSERCSPPCLSREGVGCSFSSSTVKSTLSRTAVLTKYYVHRFPYICVDIHCEKKNAVRVTAPGVSNPRPTRQVTNGTTPATATNLRCKYQYTCWFNL